MPDTVKSNFVKRIGLTELRKLKYSSRTYYVTLEPDVVASYGLMPGDLLKISVSEVRGVREHAEPEKSSVN